MPMAINGKTYYRTSEVCLLVGVSRNTLLRWFKDGKFTDTEFRDWRGWRLFTQVQLDRMKMRVQQICTVHSKK
jgi:predicted site-specific integrase-resolvase